MDIQNAMLNMRIRPKEKYEEFVNNYKKFKTDQDRVIHTLDVMLEYDLIPEMTAIPKNANQSEKLRGQGNEIFTKDFLNSVQCTKALKFYTKSIAFAPYPSKQLALGYANRSAVLFQLDMHLECIQDIDRALKLDYPDDLRPKLYIRRMESWIISGSGSIETSIIEEAQYWLDKMSAINTNKQKLQSKLNTLSNKVITQVEPEEMKSEFPLPFVESCNNEIPCASDAVAIKYNEHYGRHVVATRDIYPGEIIAIEKPYTLMLTQENVRTHCSNCLKVCWASIPCTYCTYAMYCSEECKSIEWKKCHDIECAVFPVLTKDQCYNLDLLSVRLAILAIREAGSIKELKNMLNEVDKHDDPRTKGFAQDGKLHSDKYISLYSLVTNTEKRSAPDIARRSMDSCIILYLLATRTEIFGDKLSKDLNVLMKNDDVIFLGSLILKHQQIIPTNMHSFSETRGLEVTERGYAAMPFYSLLNHSCHPNVTRYSTSKDMVLYAISPIQKDEQILDNYGQHHALLPRTERQKKLLQHYHFVCDCIACLEDWPMFYELESYKTLVTNKNDFKKIKKALQKLDIYVHQMEANKAQNIPGMVKDLSKMIQVLHDYVPMPCSEMSEVVETLKRVNDVHGNIFEIPKMRLYQK